MEHPGAKKKIETSKCSKHISVISRITETRSNSWNLISSSRSQPHLQVWKWLGFLLAIPSLLLLHGVIEVYIWAQGGSNHLTLWVDFVFCTVVLVFIFFLKKEIFRTSRCHEEKEEMLVGPCSFKKKLHSPFSFHWDLHVCSQKLNTNSLLHK